MWQQLVKIFGNWRYTGLAGVVAWLLFSLVMWLPNLSLIMTVYRADAPWLERVSIFWILYEGLFTNFTPLTGSYVVLISILFGVQAALLAYYVRSRQVNNERLRYLEFSSISGLVASALGIGCAACGSLVLSTLLASVGGAALLAILPLHGAEFGVLGVVILLYTCYRLLRAISAPAVCMVE